MFLCDEMLAGLGRWLRAAGYDTAVAVGGVGDGELVRRAVAEGRLLITRDRRLLERRLAHTCTLLVRGERLEDWVAELTPRLGIDWLMRPFSRCLLCNGELVPASSAERRRAPAGVRAGAWPVTCCRNCDKVYWPGGHAERMRARLQGWRLRETLDKPMRSH